MSPSLFQTCINLFVVFTVSISPGIQFCTFPLILRLWSLFCDVINNSILFFLLVIFICLFLVLLQLPGLSQAVLQLAAPIGFLEPTQDKIAASAAVIYMGHFLVGQLMAKFNNPIWNVYLLSQELEGKPDRLCLPLRDKIHKPDQRHAIEQSEFISAQATSCIHELTAYQVSSRSHCQGEFVA